jgi:hypothetical protein
LYGYNYSAVTDEFISSPFKREVGRGMDPPFRFAPLIPPIL